MGDTAPCCSSQWRPAALRAAPVRKGERTESRDAMRGGMLLLLRRKRMQEDGRKRVRSNQTGPRRAPLSILLSRFLFSWGNNAAVKEKWQAPNVWQQSRLYKWARSFWCYIVKFAIFGWAILSYFEVDRAMVESGFKDEGDQISYTTWFYHKYLDNFTAFRNRKEKGVK